MRTTAWYRTYREHDLWNSVERLLELLCTFASEDQDQNDHAEYVKIVLDSLYQRRDIPTPLVTLETLDSLNVEVSQVIEVVENGSMMRTYPKTQANGSRVNVTTLAPLENIVQLFSLWPDDRVASVRSAATVLRQVSTSLENKTEGFQQKWDLFDAHIDETIEAHNDSLDQKLTSIREELGEITTEVSKAAESITSFDEQAANALESQRTSQEASESSLKKQIELTVQGANNRIENTIASNKKDVDKFFADQTEAFKKYRAEQEDHTEDLIKEMNRIKDETAKVAALVSTTVVHDAHQKQANQQKRLADIWRIVGVFTLAGAIGAAIWFAFELSRDTPSEPILIGRFSVTFTIGILAWYVLKESSNHRKEEKAARSMELRLRALGPFIENHPNKETIMENAAHQLFEIERSSKSKESEGFWR